MSLRRIFVIFRKDLLDAIRDARILVTLLTPLLIGVFYSYAFGDSSIPSATMVVYDPGGSALVDQIAGTVESQVDLTIDRLDSADAVQQRIADDDADIGLVIPAGVRRGGIGRAVAGFTGAAAAKQLHRRPVHRGDPGPDPA